MRTKADVIIDVVDQGYAEAFKMSGRDHTPRELASFLQNVGAEVELFLRADVYEGKRRSWNFKKLIDELVSLGVSQQVADDLHSLRNAYNDAKHDPNYPAPIAEVLNVLSVAASALRDLKAARLGTTNAPASQSYRRLFWIAGWDFFASGVTEVAVMLPTADDRFPPRFDSIHLTCSGWTEVTNHFIAAEKLRLGRGTVPDRIYDRWKNEGDLADGGVFDGEYRELVTVLAEHIAPAERERRLIAGLRRENHKDAMVNALLMAAVDVCQAGQLPQDEDELAEWIAINAAYRYAAPHDASISMDFAPMLASLILSVPPAKVHTVTGPYWLSRASVEAALPSAIATLDRTLLVATDGRLLVEL